MPIYEYQCDQCTKTFEQIQQFSEPDPSSCPSCGQGPVRRVISPSSFQLKGTGWYVTDYKSGGAGGAASGGSDD